MTLGMFLQCVMPFTGKSEAQVDAHTETKAWRTLAERNVVGLFLKYLNPNAFAKII